MSEHDPASRGKPHVSFIVPTRNSDRTLRACLESIREQDLPGVEIVVVDNHSTDETALIADELAHVVLVQGPERSAQRNAGAMASNGDILVFIDSDMVLAPGIASELAALFEDRSVDAAVLPEVVTGSSFWERCRAIEKAAYLNDATVEAARAFRRHVFHEAGGYDETLTGPEDWELPDRIRRGGGVISRVESLVTHDEGASSLRTVFRRKAYYAASLKTYAGRGESGAARRVLRASLLKGMARSSFDDPVHVAGLGVLKATEAAGVLAGSLAASARTDRRARVYDSVAPQTKRLEDQVALIVSHELFEDGSAQALERYLRDKVSSLDVLLLPLDGAFEQTYKLRRYDGGALVRDDQIGIRTPFRRMPLSIVRDVAVSWRQALQRRRRLSLVVAVDPLNCMAQLMLRACRVIRPMIIYYTIDFVPNRFANAAANEAYHVIDRWCATRADHVWNVSEEIHEARVPHSKRPFAPHSIVPIGITATVDHAQTAPSPRLVFLGHILEKQGLQHAIAALPRLRTSVPDVELVVIGAGPYEKSCRQIADDAGVSDIVHFLGYVREGNEILRLLGEGGIGLAPYEPDPDSFTRFADPSKLKSYAAGALPILVTDVPPTARALVDAGVASIVEPNADSIAQEIEALLGDAPRFCSMSVAALRFAEKRSWPVVFESALAEAGFHRSGISA